jgi:cytochrome c oxidase subunit III
MAKVSQTENGSLAAEQSDTDLFSGDSDELTDKKYKILTWFLLVVVMMTFGGLIAAYVVISTNKVAEWQPAELPLQLWFSTFVIIVSSGVYWFAERATLANDQAKAKNWFLATTLLGVIFVVSQILAWIALTRRGLYMHGNPYLAFFYILTAVHAVHVIGGIAALSTVLTRSWYGTRDPAAMAHRKSLAQVVGWYWHFMGGLWLILFVLLGFWK